MNVNSRGHNLDTRFELFFLEIKHPPGFENPVGVISPWIVPFMGWGNLASYLSHPIYRQADFLGLTK